MVLFACKSLFLSSCAFLTGLNCFAAPPSIQVPAEDLYVKPGQPATFTAIITGRPALNIQWYKVGECHLHQHLPKSRKLIPDIVVFSSNDFFFSFD